MFEYADLYMSNKPKGLKYVVLNVYGGEALHHPDIVEILQQVHKRYQQYRDRWTLTVTNTTNAIITEKKLNDIIPLIDHFMISYHSTSTEKQKTQFKSNALTIQNSGKKLKCIVMMHTDPILFQDSQNMISWCDQNNIEYLSKQIDRSNHDFVYTEKQMIWFEKSYNKKASHTKNNVTFKKIDDKYDLADSGRACCGGRQLCVNTNYKQRVFYIENKFPDWYCSVNEFFLYIKQVNGEIFVNKDCKMSFDSSVGPIGNL
jgi:pyruvate-formate lyase-activating enzyme